MDLDDLDVYADGPKPQVGQPAEGQEDEERKKKPKARRAPARKKPKLKIEHLQQPAGLQEVFQKFPKWFQEGYRGKGHEVRDLRRLLELYQRWQPRVFPHGTYNQFEQTLEKMSGTHALKEVLSKMRQDLCNIVDPPTAQHDAEQQQQDEQQQDQGAHQQQQAAGENGGGLNDFGNIDDDELLALQAEDVALEAAEAAVPELFDQFDQHKPATAAAQQTPNPMGDGNHNTTKRSMRDWSDDDDDSDGALAYMQQQQPAPTATPGAPAADGNRNPDSADVAVAADQNEEYLNDLLDDILEDQDLLVDEAAVGGLPGEVGQRQTPVDAGAGMVDTQQQQQQHSRLQRTAASADSNEDADMADPNAEEVGEPTGSIVAAVKHHHHQQQQHETLHDDDNDDAIQQAVTKHTQQRQRQQQRRRWLLADDDSDSEIEDHAVAAAQAVPSQPPVTQVSDQAELGTQQQEQFAPLVLGGESVGFDSVDEMELVMGTDLDELQQ